MFLYLVQKETQCVYLQFLGLKILISKVVLIQWFCLLIKTLIAEFRRKLNTVLCFECKILKSKFLTQKFRLTSYLIKFRFECDL